MDLISPLCLSDRFCQLWKIHHRCLHQCLTELWFSKDLGTIKVCL